MKKDFLHKIRLNEFEIEAIIYCFKENFLDEDHIWLFGSRADSTRRGGDIDLYIETWLSADAAAKARSEFNWALLNKIGDQKIDIVLHIMNDEFHIPIYDIARSEGVQLI